MPDPPARPRQKHELVTGWSASGSAAASAVPASPARKSPNFFIALYQSRKGPDVAAILAADRQFFVMAEIALIDDARLVDAPLLQQQRVASSKSPTSA